MKVFRKPLIWILTWMVLTAALSVPASAAKKSVLTAEDKYHVLELTKIQSPYAILLDAGAKVSSLKSSRSKVASAAIETYDGISYIVVTPKKKGKTTVSFKYTWKKKTKKYRFVFTVVPYENPLRSLKIGKKGYAYKFRKNSYYALKGKVSGKLKLKAAKGWKIVDLALEEKGHFVTVQAGKKLKLKRGQSLYVTCFNGSRYTTLILDCPEKESTTGNTNAVVAKKAVKLS